MSFVNEASWDRILRVVGGAALVILYFTGVLTGAWGIVLAVLGGVFIVTGLIGWCPIYALLHLRTNRRVGTPA